ncbi:hypothetical protein [Pseudomonas fragi]|uniref:hypothetical protein n=1 Tax=Pseudomonas fragi TaxID=296 RepID=UPI00147638F8|nr:hypothetical protein [Pseudomonas fragi]NNB34026.1 hypothetical protein [Pseudomonas fragi]
MNKLKPTALLLCGCLVLPINFAQAESVTTTDSACDIDDMMTANVRKMDEMAVGIYKKNLEVPIANQIETAPNVKDASCLPILDTLDTLLRMRIPSTGALMSGIMAKIRDMSCKFANDFISGIAGKLSYNISDPYGVASIGVGATNGSGGVQTETYDFGAIVADKVADAAAAKAREISREQTKAVTNSLPNAASDRTPRIENTIDKGVKDAMDGL